MSDIPTPAERPAVILVCDDDPDARAIIVSTLSVLGHEIIETEDGAQAKALCETQLPDVAVVDIMMPRLTGTEFVTWLRAYNNDRYVPVLFLTALTEVEQKVQGLNIGADDYLTKPYHYRELQARVSALLRIKRLTEDLIAKERALVAMQTIGATAHHLGQPLTTILFQCELLARAMQSEDGAQKTPERIRDTIRAIKNECETIRQVLARLPQLSSAETTSYVGSLSILEMK